MTIQKVQKQDELIVSIQGRLDTLTAPELEHVLAEENPEKLVFDLKELEYISSAGLRVLLAAHKRMSSKGGVIVRNSNEIVREVFEVTGFVDILTLE